MKRKIAAALCIFALTAGAVFGTGLTEEASAVENYLDVMTAPGQLPIVTEPVTLSVLTIAGANIIDIDTNYATQWIEEQTGINLDFEILLTGSEAGERINLILASGDALPDVMLNSGLQPRQLDLYGSQGRFLPLNDLIDEYGVEVKRMWAAEPAYRSQMTHIDGNIYALWDISVCHHCMYQSKFWINTEWLKNVGHDVPSTTEEFYEVLKTFKEQDANGNGDPNDEIPFSGAITGWNNSVDTFLMNAFIYNDRGSGYLNVVNDAVVPAFTQPEWRDGLTFFHRLYREGLLDHESFIQNVDQLAQLARAGDYNRLGVFPAGTPLMVVSGSGERKREFAALPPLTGPKGNNTAAFYPPGVAFGRGARYVISAESRMPQIAYRLGDFLLSEEAYYVTFFGEEGVNWRRANPGEVGVDGNPAIFKEINTPRNEPQQNQVLNHMVPVYVTQEQFLGRVTDISDPYYVEYWLERETTEHYDGHEPDQVLLPLKILIEDLAEYSELQVTVNAYRAESFARFVTGDWDLEGDWDAYLRELDQIGLDRYLQLTQEAWDRDYAD